MLTDCKHQVTSVHFVHVSVDTRLRRAMMKAKALTIHRLHYSYRGRPGNETVVT